MLGSVELSYTNSPGTAHSSAILPLSTMTMHWPSATATTEPLEMMLSAPRRLEEKPLTFFWPLTTSVLLSMASQ